MLLKEKNGLRTEDTANEASGATGKKAGFVKRKFSRFFEKHPLAEARLVDFANSFDIGCGAGRYARVAQTYRDLGRFSDAGRYHMKAHYCTPKRYLIYDREEYGMKAAEDYKKAGKLSEAADIYFDLYLEALNPIQRILLIKKSAECINEIPDKTHLSVKLALILSYYDAIDTIEMCMNSKYRTKPRALIQSE